MQPSTFPAILGGNPLFSLIKRAGQLNFPSWNDYEDAFRGIFERQWYTNHGPLANQLEQRLAETLGVKHAVCTATAALGVCIATEALGLDGPVIVPAMVSADTVQALRWSKVEPIFCGVDLDNYHIDIAAAERLLRKGARGLFAVNLWGSTADTIGLEALAAAFGVPLYFDSSSGYGCAVAGRPIGSFGNAEVISMHSDELLNATEGGVITTNDGDLAERMRNIRSSYGARRTVAVARTANGRMSEAQAAMALCTLKNADVYIKRNQELHRAYRKWSADIPGLNLMSPEEGKCSNYSWAVCILNPAEFGLCPRELSTALQLEGVDAPPIEAMKASRISLSTDPVNESFGDLRVGDEKSEGLLRLPLGAAVDVEGIKEICGRIGAIQSSAHRIRNILRGTI